MSFKLCATEPLDEALRRIFSEQFQAALDEIGAPSKSKDKSAETVHEVRKHIKKLRAMLRLTRDGIGGKRSSTENKRLRDAGRKLSDFRDAKVRLDTLKLLGKEYLGKDRRAGFSETRRKLKSEFQQIAPEAKKALVKVSTILKTECSRVDAWPFSKVDWDDLCHSLRCAYKRARAAFRAAARKPSVTRMHEWRKRTKDLRYFLQVLTPLCPEVISELQHEAKTLGDVIGEEHDLAMLRDALKKHDTSEREAILILIDTRRRELKQAALDLGAHLFEEKPRMFVEKFSGYWKHDQISGAYVSK